MLPETVHLWSHPQIQPGKCPLLIATTLVHKVPCAWHPSVVPLFLIAFGPTCWFQVIFRHTTLVEWNMKLPHLFLKYFRSYGIVRLTDPVGMDLLKDCDESGFHTHRETTNGSPVYETCSKVHFNPNLRFEIVDLRSDQWSMGLKLWQHVLPCAPSWQKYIL